MTENKPEAETEEDRKRKDFLRLIQQLAHDLLQISGAETLEDMMVSVPLIAPEKEEKR